ncbi:hypothetical protein CRENBAI_005790 [Crenichthys baileyi]|uniref:Uncharacterized protein n=1 Tax=Crenichthys baileyi TaxID=28760 RepID=A0AAV9RG82_9TELE
MTAVGGEELVEVVHSSLVGVVVGQDHAAPSRSLEEKRERADGSCRCLSFCSRFCLSFCSRFCLSFCSRFCLSFFSHFCLSFCSRQRVREPVVGRHVACCESSSQVEHHSHPQILPGTSGTRRPARGRHGGEEERRQKRREKIGKMRRERRLEDETGKDRRRDGKGDRRLEDETGEERRRERRLEDETGEERRRERRLEDETGEERRRERRRERTLEDKDRRKEEMNKNHVHGEEKHGPRVPQLPDRSELVLGSPLG